MYKNHDFPQDLLFLTTAKIKKKMDKPKGLLTKHILIHVCEI